VPHFHKGRQRDVWRYRGHIRAHRVRCAPRSAPRGGRHTAKISCEHNLAAPEWCTALCSLA